MSFISNLFGGHAKNTDRKEELSGFGDLNNVFNFGINQSRNANAAGNDLLGQAGAYDTRLLSGNRNTVNQAIAPVANEATDQTDAEKRQIAASGTARGGGVNATNQNLDANKQAIIDNAANSAIANAAKGATEVGGIETANANRLLGIAADAGGNAADIASKSRGESNALSRQTGSDIDNLLNTLLLA